MFNLVRIDHKSECMGDSACSNFLKSSCPFNSLKIFFPAQLIPIFSPLNSQKSNSQKPIEAKIFLQI